MSNASRQRTAQAICRSKSFGRNLGRTTSMQASNRSCCFQIELSAAAKRPRRMLWYRSIVIACKPGQFLQRGDDQRWSGRQKETRAACTGNQVTQKSGLDPQHKPIRPGKDTAMPLTRKRIETRREFIKQSAIAAGMVTLCKGPAFLTPKRGADDAINKLRSKFSGQLVLPGDPEYDAACRVVEINPDNDKHPAVVAQCKHNDDILWCIEFAHRQQMEVAAFWAGEVVTKELSSTS